MTIRRRITAAKTGVISAIEIAYFRSFYKVYFGNLDKMNVFFGENDTGKSNVMRALNLFFNNVVSDNYEFDVAVDFSSKRATQAAGEGDVRKFSYVKIWFRAPAVHKAALGEEFYVKRTWSESTIPDFRQETSRHIDSPGKQQSLTKFLNKIKFTYIPAVKDRAVYETLLAQAYDAIAQSAAFGAALAVFTDEIREQTLDLTARLGESLNMKSEIAPPTDLAELFESLDFRTFIADGDAMSLLRQRGDGVQARHIPEMMAFIADKDNHQFHIWGVEEPENSLSINSATLLANRLLVLSKEGGVQAFVTTHSPAFYSISAIGVHKTFLKSGEDDVQVFDGTHSSAHDLLEFMGDRFYLPIVAESVAAAKLRADELEAAAGELRSRIDHANRPILFVEGESDKLLIEYIISSVATPDDPQVEVVPLGSASHANRLSGMTEPLVRRLLNGREGFVLLDSDSAGRKALPNDLSVDRTMGGWSPSSNSIGWRLLPVSPEASTAFTAARVTPQAAWGVCLEDCYSAETRALAVAANAYGLGAPRDLAWKGDLLAITPCLTDAAHKFYLLKPLDRFKMTFVRWLIANGHAEAPVLVEIVRSMLVRLRP